MEFEGKTAQKIATVLAHDAAIYDDDVADSQEKILQALQHFSNRGLMQARGGLREVLTNQMEWSLRTFGSGRRTIGITKHIEKECAEVRDNPDDLSEWVDIMILAMDGYWRAGGTPEMLLHDIIAKQSINRERTYPKTNEDEPSEHIRECHPYEIGSKP
jgi:hypothetical protein